MSDAQAQHASGTDVAPESVGAGQSARAPIAANAPIGQRWYVLQVTGGREAATLAQCRKLVDAQVLTECFAPEAEYQWKTKDGWQLRRKLLFPGYLFCVTSDVSALNDALRKVPELTKLLGKNPAAEAGASGAGNAAGADAGAGSAGARATNARAAGGSAAESRLFFPLSDSERDWFMAFTDSKRVVRMSEGFIEGDTVKVTSGPLRGREASIRKIDRHKRRAYIDVSLFGRTVPATIGLEILWKRAEA